MSPWRLAAVNGLSIIAGSAASFPFESTWAWLTVYLAGFIVACPPLYWLLDDKRWLLVSDSNEVLRFRTRAGQERRLHQFFADPHEMYRWQSHHGTPPNAPLLRSSTEVLS